MRKVNFEEKTRLINEFRLENAKKTFTYNEMQVELRKAGITGNSTTFTGLLKFFPSTLVDGRNLYEMPIAPIHISQVKEAWRLQKSYMATYNARKKAVAEKPIVGGDVTSFSDEVLINELKNRNYRIQKCTGFDLERFKREHSVMFQNYQTFEEL